MLQLPRNLFPNSQQCNVVGPGNDPSQASLTVLQKEHLNTRNFLTSTTLASSLKSETAPTAVKRTVSLTQEKPPKLFAGKYHCRTYSAHSGKENNKTKE